MVGGLQRLLRVTHVARARLLWTLGGLLLSFGANLSLVHAAVNGARTRWVVARYAIPLGLTIVLMVLRPKWSWLDT